MLKRSTLASLVVVALLCLAAPISQAQAVAQFDLPAQSLAVSLRAVGSQTSTNVLFDPPLVEGMNAPSVSGELTAEEALQRLLAGTGLKYRFLDEKTVMVVAAKDAAAKPTASDSNTGPAAESDDQGLQGIPEVVVTVTRLETNAQRTAMSMDVVDSAQIRRQGIQDVQSLVASVPSLSLNQAAGVILAIRGVAARDTSDIGDPSIVVSNDGFYNDRNQALLQPQYDLARIEVLKGPQGTLVGRNATGGAINFITVKPSAEPGGYVTLDVGNYDKVNAEGAINMPLSDKVWTRFSARSEDYSGYRTCGEFGRCDDFTKSSFRGQLTYNPTDDIRLHVLAQRSKGTTHGTGFLNTPFIPDATGHVTHEPPPVGPLSRIDNVGSQVPTYINVVDEVVRWDATWNAPWTTATYLGGWEDIDYGSETNASTKRGPASAWVPLVNGLFLEPRVTSHELRFASADQDDRITYQVGAYYFNNEGSSRTYQSPYASPRTFTSATVSEAINLRSLSYFGQLGFKLTDALKLTVGTRYNDDKKSLVDLPSPLTNPSARRYNSGATREWTYHAGLDWQVTPVHMLYAKWDTGYKAGGFTVFGDYGPELVTTYEVGSKNRFLDNRLQFNITAFSSHFTDQQVSQLSPIPNCPAPCTNFQVQTVNAGATRTWGVETDATLVTDFGNFNLAATYLNNEFTKFVTDLRQTDVLVNGAWTTRLNNLDLTGNTERLSPPWTVVAGYQLTRPFYAGDVTGTLQVRYQDDLYLSFLNIPTEAREANTIINVNLGYRPTEGAWQIEAYVRNLTNDVFNYIANENNSGFFYSQGLSPPRTYGVTFAYRW
ncbi:MAG TPA: TonB-dependent receptor [Steroidobacteraceae bacterium]|nr:TonB-dependent receptor [Steroidobacteraceae bacterium]